MMPYPKKKLVASQHVQKTASHEPDIRVYGKIKKKGTKGDTVEQTTGEEIPAKQARLEQHGGNKSNDDDTMSNHVTKAPSACTQSKLIFKSKIPRENVRSGCKTSDNICRVKTRASLKKKLKLSEPVVSKGETKLTRSSRRTRKARVSCWNVTYVNKLKTTFTKTQPIVKVSNCQKNERCTESLSMKCGETNLDSQKQPFMLHLPAITPEQDGIRKTKLDVHDTAVIESGAPRGGNVDYYPLCETNSSAAQRSLTSMKAGSNMHMEAEEDVVRTSVVPSVGSAELCKTEEHESRSLCVAPSVVHTEAQTCTPLAVFSDLTEAEDAFLLLLNRKIDELETTGEPEITRVIAACKLVKFYMETGQYTTAGEEPGEIKLPSSEYRDDDTFYTETSKCTRNHVTRETSTPITTSVLAKLSDPLASQTEPIDLSQSINSQSYSGNLDALCMVNSLTATTAPVQIKLLDPLAVENEPVDLSRPSTFRTFSTDLEATRMTQSSASAAREDIRRSLEKQLTQLCYDDALCEEDLALARRECSMPESLDYELDTSSSRNTANEPAITGGDLCDTHELPVSPGRLIIDEDPISVDTPCNHVTSPLDSDSSTVVYEMLSQRSFIQEPTFDQKRCYHNNTLWERSQEIPGGEYQQTTNTKDISVNMSAATYPRENMPVLYPETDLADSQNDNRESEQHLNDCMFHGAISSVTHNCMHSGSDDPAGNNQLSYGAAIYPQNYVPCLSFGETVDQRLQTPIVRDNFQVANQICPASDALSQQDFSLISETNEDAQTEFNMSVLQLAVHNLGQLQVPPPVDAISTDTYSKMYQTTALDRLTLHLGLNKRYHKMKLTVTYPKQTPPPDVDVTIPKRKPLRRPKMAFPSQQTIGPVD